MGLFSRKTPAEKEREEIAKILKLENDEFKRFTIIFKAYDGINQTIETLGNDLYSCFIHDIGRIPRDIDSIKNSLRLLLQPNARRDDIIDSIYHNLNMDIRMIKELRNHQENATIEPFKILRKRIVNLHEDLVGITKDIKGIHRRIKLIQNYESELFHEKKVQAMHLINLIENYTKWFEKQLENNIDAQKKENSQISILIDRINKLFLEIINYVGYNLNNIVKEIEANKNKANPNYTTAYNICAENLSDANFKKLSDNLNFKLKEIILQDLYKAFKEMQTLSNHEKENAEKIKEAIDNLQSLVVKS